MKPTLTLVSDSTKKTSNTDINSKGLLFIDDLVTPPQEYNYFLSQTQFDYLHQEVVNVLGNTREAIKLLSLLIYIIENQAIDK